MVLNCHKFEEDSNKCKECNFGYKLINEKCTVTLIIFRIVLVFQMIISHVWNVNKIII